ncbi:hypothetical protein [Nonomuraea jabiensis]|uniref:hypothetical protein n=1 Tax=Nonomuraea jabiensis TaxID=882448 RepID=UPI003D71C7DF
MTRSYFELLILLLNLASADALAVIAGVLHKAMLTLDERTFRNFLKPLHKGAQRSPYLIITATLHVVLFIPYFIIYGFDNLWFTAGAIVAVAASTFISKPVILPTYQMIYDKLDPADTAAISTWRDILGRRNKFRAAIQFVSVALMTIGLYGIS